MTGSTQYTDEWWGMRRGRVTASRCEPLIFGSMERLMRLAEELKAEATQEKPDHFNKRVGGYAQWGLDHEEEAIKHYAFEAAVTVERPVFIQHPAEEYAGSSPDFFTEHETGEVKCPAKEEHFWRRALNPLSRTEFCQVQWQLYCSPEKEAGIYVVYAPYVEDPAARLHWRRVPREEAFQEKIADRMKTFNKIMRGEVPGEEERRFF